MADAKLPMFGKAAKIILLYGGAKVPNVEGQTTSWNVKRVTNGTRTGIAGRSAKRVDQTVDGFDADLAVEVPDLALFNFLQAISTDRETGSIKELAVGLEFLERDGKIEGVVLGTCVADWEVNMGNTSEHITGKVTLQGETYGALTL